MDNTFRALGPVSRLFDALVWLLVVVSGTMMVVLIAIFGWLVWGRYVMNDTPTWVEQVSLVLVVWITFLGASVGVRRGHHLSIDFVRDGLPGAIRLPLTYLTHAAMIVLGVIMAWQGWELAIQSFDRIIPMLGIAEGWRDLPVAICGVLTALFSFEHLAAQLRGQKGA